MAQYASSCRLPAASNQNRALEVPFPAAQFVVRERSRRATLLDNAPRLGQLLYYGRDCSRDSNRGKQVTDRTITYRFIAHR
jgi:hypothetical protein